MATRLLHGDCLELMRDLPDNSVEACVTDPPAGIEFMGKDWDSFKNRKRSKGWAQGGKDGNDGFGGFAKTRRPAFCSQTREDRDSFIAFIAKAMSEVRRVLKPGAHALVWAIPRTSHWTAMALEEAGFEVRDVITHHFGSGFPKSLNVSRAIDRRRIDDIRPVCRFVRRAIEGSDWTTKGLAEEFGFHPRMIDFWAARETDSQPAIPRWEQWLKLKNLLGFSDEMDTEVWRLNDRKGKPGDDWGKREVIGRGEAGLAATGWREHGNVGFKPEYDITAPATAAAKQWDGWGTALKPASEHWILCRKPLAEKNIATNVVAHGTGGLNIDACRIPLDGEAIRTVQDGKNGGGYDVGSSDGTRHRDFVNTQGRWPANLAFSHAAECGDECAEGCPVAGLDQQSDGASRFFFVAKPAVSEKEDGLDDLPAGTLNCTNPGGLENDPHWGPVDRKNTHPTVKPTELMRCLIRLITPPGGTVLDPFMGSGTTGVAAVLEGFSFIGMEQDAQYIEIARARLLRADKRKRDMPLTLEGLEL